MSDQPSLWYKDAIIYELHVRAFFDSNGDGIGDFAGLAERLEYLQDLGVTAIWLLPFYASPLRDDGYDIADYRSVHPDYGTLAAFRSFLKEAHRRGLKVITELVLNHTSDQHAWFQAARCAPPGSPERDFYVWSDTAERYREARIIFQDFEASNWTWDARAQAYFWHRFYSHQPDLNFDNPEVRREMLRVVDFWFGMGVDGLRLDAVPYLYEREGTGCENLPETHSYLQQLRAHVDAHYKDRMLLAEANQWPDDATAYFGQGNECHMAFHFPLMPRMFMAVSMEDRFPIIDILQQTPKLPDTSQWAVFLRNHDELTLEMVTDEERDYMYRSYAHDPRMRINLGIRRRLAPLLQNNRRKIELLNALLFSMVGTPVIYYGDEIGMGDNTHLGDRNGVRTPLQWSPDRNAGFSRANPQSLFLPVITDPEYHYETINVETQRRNPQSLFWWMKRLIALRKRYPVFSRGTLEFLHPENRHVLAFVRRYDQQRILMVANLSRFVQAVELDLSEFEGMIPVELFGQNPFPRIGELPYFVTLGPHGFYWFSLEPEREPAVRVGAPEAAEPATLAVTGDWETLLGGREQDQLESVLPAFLMRSRWFGGKSRSIASANVTEIVPLHLGDLKAAFTFVRVTYREGDAETYLLPLGFAEGEWAKRLAEWHPKALVARVQVRHRGEVTEGIIHDVSGEKQFAEALLASLRRRKKARGRHGVINAWTTPAFAEVVSSDGQPEALEPSTLTAEQSNTSVAYGSRFILKLFRRLEEGTNPDLETGMFLMKRGEPRVTPRVVGAFEYERDPGPEARRPEQKRQSLAIAQEFIPNEGSAWNFVQDNLVSYLETVMAEGPELVLELPDADLLQLAGGDAPPTAVRLMGLFLHSTAQLGRRTGHMHLALAGSLENPDFAPQRFSALDQRSMYQSMRNLAGRVFRSLRLALKTLPRHALNDARIVLDLEGDILEQFRDLIEIRMTGKRIRCHGDYHLGQVLYTGKDFVIIDFEGEPARPLTERRLKQSALQDVAGMLRSFHYAAETVLANAIKEMPSEEEVERAMVAVRYWYAWAGSGFLRFYLETTEKAEFMPSSPDEIRTVLQANLIRKALYEVTYELNNRPDWVHLPLRGIQQVLRQPRGSA